MVNPFARAWRGLQSLAVRFAGWPVSQTPGILFNAPVSSAGVEVTEEGTLSLSAVFAAVNLLSQIMGTVPLRVYRQVGRSRDIAYDEPAYRILAWSPNPEMTSATARRVIEFHRLLWGNGYAEIQWAGNGKAKAVWPLEPWRVRPQRDGDGSLHYLIDGRRRIAPEDMIHVPLISYDGVAGRSFVEYAIQSLGLGLAQQEFAARYFGNGARPGAILTHPGNPKPEARAEFRESWDSKHGGPRKAHGTAVLWGGWTYTADGSFDPEKSQLLEQRRFATEEVARWLNIPPHLLRDLSRATFANIEEQGIDFVDYTLGPTGVQYEQEYDRKLLNPPNLTCKHCFDGLLKGNRQARSAYYREMFNVGVASINEIRAMEDMNPIPDGDTHFVPLNMVPLEKALNPDPEPAPTAPTPPEAPGNDRNPDPDPAGDEGYDDPAPTMAMRRLAEHTLRRLAKVEGMALARAAKQPGKILAWMDEFYPAHEARLADALQPIAEACETCGVTFCPAPPLAAAEAVAASRDGLLNLAGGCTPAQLPAKMAELIVYLEGDGARDAAAKLIYSDDQPREPDGKFGSGGGSSHSEPVLRPEAHGEHFEEAKDALQVLKETKDSDYRPLERYLDKDGAQMRAALMAKGSVSPPVSDAKKSGEATTSHLDRVAGAAHEDLDKTQKAEDRVTKSVKALVSDKAAEPTEKAAAKAKGVRDTQKEKIDIAHKEALGAANAWRDAPESEKDGKYVAMKQSYHDLLSAAQRANEATEPKTKKLYSEAKKAIRAADKEAHAPTD